MYPGTAHSAYEKIHSWNWYFKLIIKTQRNSWYLLTAAYSVHACTSCMIPRKSQEFTLCFDAFHIYISIYKRLQMRFANNSLKMSIGENWLIIAH